MGLPTGMRYTSTVTGHEWKTVTCEHCGEQYAYKVERKATGTGRSVLFLDNDGAKQRAAEQAHANIQQELDKAIEPVWCPRCGKYQANMLRIVRFDRVVLWYVLAFVVVVIGLITCAFWGDTSFGQNLIGVPGVFVWCLAGTIVIYALVRASFIQPNALAEVNARAGKQPARIPVMLRSEYEALVEKKVAEGTARERLLSLTW